MKSRKNGWVKTLTPHQAADKLRELSRKNGGTNIHHAIDHMIGWTESGSDQTDYIRRCRKTLAEAMQILRQTNYKLPVDRIEGPIAPTFLEEEEEEEEEEEDEEDYDEEEDDE